MDRDCDLLVRERRASQSKLRLEEIKLNVLNGEYVKNYQERTCLSRSFLRRRHPFRERRTNLNFFLSLPPPPVKNKLDPVFAKREAQMVEDS